ncbi:MAG: amidohydrolase family protein [Actinobacteria bacterium]|nr:amidohydrolase family protein [Actinomycetota bacterium]
MDKPSESTPVAIIDPTTSQPQPQTPEWFAQVVEPIVDPGQRVIDPHHHLWPPGGSLPYSLDDLHADTGSGHNIVKTMFVECGAAYDLDAPADRASLGETRFAAHNAALSASAEGSATIAGIVANVDLRLDNVDQLLDAHLEVAGDLLKGIRHSGARAVEPEAMMIAGSAPEGLYADPAFRRGVQRLGARGLTYDTWQYHHQVGEFIDLVDACPGTTMVLDHFSTPIGVGKFAGLLDEIFEQWAVDIADLATRANVVAKIGGLAMPDNGYSWHTAAKPATSDEFAAAQNRWYHHTIEAFGPSRCMFESNFPVDRFSISYPVLWNGLKKIAGQYSDSERDAMFYGTANRVYSL